jgi:predicted nucleic acid-binding protein
MAIVDASFLVASWNEGEPFHKEARRRLAAMPPGTKLRVNAGALVEASQIIRKAAKSAGQDGPGASRNFLGAFLALPGASIFTAHADEAWPLHVSNKALSFTDAWILAQARAAHDEVWTFDKGLVKEARRRA